MTNGHVDALHTQALLIQDRVNGNRRLTGLAVTNNEFALPSTNWGHGVNSLDTRLQRFAHRLATDDARRLNFHASNRRIDERTLAVNGLTESVHDASQQGVAHRHRENLPRGANNLFFFDSVHGTKNHGTNGLFIEVHGETYGSVGKFEELVHLRRWQTRNASNTVAHFHHTADLFGAHRWGVFGYVAPQRIGDFAGTNRELSHHFFLFLFR